MNKKIGIATLYTGFNFGSSLQAYAVKCLFEKFDYKTEILKIKGSVIKGRDIRLKKMFIMLTRCLAVKGGLKQLKNYRNGYAKKIKNESKIKFNNFTVDFLQVKELSFNKIKKNALKSEYKAFVCGSDQIWNATALYVDPFYYLRFAPQEKRIAFAPSFGKEAVPPYNVKKITKYISEIPYKSAREISGVEIIKSLTGEDVQALLDPTLLISSEEWCAKFKINKNEKSDYLLAYFLDVPSEKAIKAIEKIIKEYKLKIINLPYDFSEIECFSDTVSAGPIEFIELIKKAKFICTDSFHGVAFSLNFNVPFFAFDRNYGLAGNQSTRIISLLNLTRTLDRFEPENVDNCFNLSFGSVNEILNIERKKAYSYIKECLNNIS